jgi:transglutaminase/protease-like cytokinesis protein 3
MVGFVFESLELQIRLHVELCYYHLFGDYRYCLWLICIRVLESLKEGKRLPEARFSHLKIAAKAQNSVYELCSKQDTISNTPMPSTPPSGQSSLYD